MICYLLKFRIIIVLSLVLLSCGDEGGSSATEFEPDKVYIVKKSVLKMGINEYGQVLSRNSFELTPPTNWHRKISWLEKEGESVKEGDVVIKFDSEQIQKSIEDQSISLVFQREGLASLLDDVNMEISDNISSMKKASNVLDAKVKLYRKFKNEESIQKIKDLARTIDSNLISERAIAESISTLSDEIFIKESSGGNNSSLKSKMSKLESNLRVAKDKTTKSYRLLKAYKTEQVIEKLKLLKIQVNQEKLNFKKVKTKCISGALDIKKKIINNEKRIKANLARLKQTTKMLEMCSVKAPISGVIYYRNRYGRKLKAGDRVWNNQVIMTIPDLKSLKVSFDLGEEYRTKVEKGTVGTITVSAIPGLRVDMEVSSISNISFPRNSSDPSSPKVYKAEAILKGDELHSDLVPGMTAKIEIAFREIKDVLVVPVESVFEKEGAYFVYRNNSKGEFKKSIIELGISSEHEVEVTKGLGEGDEILLYSLQEE
ncbi:MAG: hypothetical protein COA79_15145 [Planctomycetota bacterium]|nr:MAG: hypothetical protein COA79_15145 [Planctomycetota bacterium]